MTFEEVSAIIGVVINALILAYTYGRLTSRVDAISVCYDKTERAIHDIGISSRDTIERVIQLEGQTKEVTKAVSGLQNTLRNGLSQRVDDAHHRLDLQEQRCVEHREDDERRTHDRRKPKA